MIRCVVLINTTDVLCSFIGKLFIQLNIHDQFVWNTYNCAQKILD